MTFAREFRPREFEVRSAPRIRAEIAEKKKRSFRLATKLKPKVAAAVAALVLATSFSSASVVAQNTSFHSHVVTKSMVPTLMPGDHFLVNPVTYRIRANNRPQRGEIVATEHPTLKNQEIVKRVIGLPGEEFFYDSKSATVYIDGKAIYRSKLTREEMKQVREKLATIGLDSNQFEIRREAYGADRTAIVLDQKSQNGSFGPVRIPEDHYVVLGDDRPLSEDTRIFGFIHRDQIRGPVTGFIWNSDSTD